VIDNPASCELCTVYGQNVMSEGNVR
jgi:hypothetical protein